MARNEEDREDLMKEATALIRRVELKMDDQEELIFAGFKRSGNLSIYFNPDLVYHFDEKERLRRAFIAPFLYRSNGDSLSRLTRVRTETTSELHAKEISETELKEFCDEMQKYILVLLEAMNSSQINIIKQIPDEADLIKELSNSLNQLLTLNGELSPAIVSR